VSIVNRTFSIHGKCESNTSITVKVDGVVCQDGPVSGTKLFSFENDVTCHGKVEIEIWVNSGGITLGKTTVTYPALYTHSIFAKYLKGTISFQQVFHSKYIFNNGILTKFEPDTITVKDYFKFDHVTFNGPKYLFILHSENLVPNINLDYTDQEGFFMFDPSKKDYHLMPVYDYENKFVNWETKEDNLKSLDELLLHVYGTTVQ
jgi:hypothetical protein